MIVQNTLLRAGAKVLVTGGTGFIGAYIIKKLIEKGYSVRAIRRSSKMPFFISADTLQKAEWVDGDVLDSLTQRWLLAIGYLNWLLFYWPLLEASCSSPFYTCVQCQQQQRRQNKRRLSLCIEQDQKNKIIIQLVCLLC